EYEEEKEEIPVKEEEISDEDLHELFVQEGQKYINLIQEGIERLKSNPGDKEARELIYKNSHALKGSSKMMGYEEIGQICEKVERIFEDLVNRDKKADIELLEAVEKLSENLLERPIQPQEADALLSRWEVEDEVKIDEDRSTIEYVVLSEQDQDLLQIFEEEAGDVIKQMKGISKYLREFTMEPKIRMELEQALHKIDSAAKMLGFEEIANIVDKINGILEAKELNEEKDVKTFATLLLDSTEIINKLAKERKIEKQQYEKLNRALDGFLSGEYVPELSQEDTIVHLQKKLTQKVHAAGEKESVSAVAEEGEPEAAEIRDDVIQLFINEVNTTLEHIQNTFVDLELYPDDNEKTYQLFRLMHTLKGAASMVNMEKLQQLAHKFEDVLEMYYQQKRPLPVVMLSLLQKGVEEIKYMVQNIAQQKKEITTPQFPVLISNLTNLEQSFKKTESKEEMPRDLEEGEQELKSSLKDQEIVKIPINKLDDLLNNSVELVVTNNELVGFINKLTNEVKRLENERKELTELKSLSKDIFQHYIEIYELTKKLTPQKHQGLEQSELIRPSLENLMNKLENLYMEIKTLETGIKNTLRDFELNFEKTNKISNRLYDYILQVRMVPISMLFDLFPRAVEEIAKKHNKKIELEIEGGETELDRSMVEHLFEPLLHIIRNAIDHGIETVDERRKTGKPEKGKIHLAAKQEKDHVVITLSDDGRGINFEKIREKAIEKGLLSKQDSEKLTDEELLRFLFQPGFSTSDKISEISGRGVGLDVVERQIRRLKGELQIETEEGKGTTFIMKFPITLSVSQCILIKINDNHFGIPLYNVEKTFEIKGEAIKEGKNYYECEREGKKYELIYLNELMNLGHLDLTREEKKEHSYSVLVLRGRMNHVGLLVDRIEKRAELIVKPLGQQLQNFPYISGGAILPDASIALILDVDEIIEKFVMEHSVDSADKSSRNSVVFLKRLTKKNKIQTENTPRIMVIDDSESVREYMKNFLSDLGYHAEVFGNVDEARKYLEQQIPHLIIVDLELPEVSGYEFILNLGKDKRFKQIPFMFFTGKKVEMIENLAKDLDALGYILKPFDENELKKKLSKLFVQIEK
ncbi:MAG: response regulator, partial [Ignavibacteria bacterium]